MFIGVGRSKIFRGPLLYFLWGWVPATVISGAAAVVLRCRPSNFLETVIFTVLGAGTFAPGFVAYASGRAGASARGCLPTVLAVLVSGAVSAVPMLLGLVAYGALRAGGNGPEVAIVAVLALPVAALAGGLPSIPGYYLGVSVGRATSVPGSGGRPSPGQRVQFQQFRPRGQA